MSWAIRFHAGSAVKTEAAPKRRAPGTGPADLTLGLKGPVACRLVRHGMTTARRSLVAKVSERFERRAIGRRAGKWER